MDTPTIQLAMQPILDAAPQTKGPYEQGWQDYHRGVYEPPRGYTDGFADYLKGYNDAWAEDTGRTILR